MSATLPSAQVSRAPLRAGATDAALATRAAAGDALAFEQLYDRHAQRVLNLCARILGSHHDAADATQETFIRFLRRLPSLDVQHASVGPYLFTCARHVCFDLLGRAAKVDLAEDPDGRPVGGREPHPAVEDPERSALIGATRDDVRAACDRLAPRHREVLQLREVEELSYEDIGEVLGLKANAVAQLISRARLRLRDELRGSALASVARSGEDCERATTALSSGLDGRAQDDTWLAGHLAACEHCRLAAEALAEAGRSYRLLVPLVPLEVLRRTTLARAAEPLADLRRERGGDRDGASTGSRWRPTKGQAAAGVLSVLALLALVVPAATSDERRATPASPVRETATPDAATPREAPALRGAPRRPSADLGAAPEPTASSPSRGVPAAADEPVASRSPTASPRRAGREGTARRGTSAPPVSGRPAPTSQNPAAITPPAVAPVEPAAPPAEPAAPDATPETSAPQEPPVSSEPTRPPPPTDDGGAPDPPVRDPTGRPPVP